MLVGARAGSSYSEPEYVNWLRDAGFSDVRRVRLPGPAGMMIAAGAQFSELDLSGDR
jgi:xanthine/CO dehydrogenase XdhC/CoxF family maturation factor